MLVRLIADREPYASYIKEGDPEGSLFFAPAAGAEAELLVLPADRLLGPGAPPRAGTPCFAYGPVSLMAACFAAGCADYLREPWSLAELRARAARAELLRVRAGEMVLELRDDCLAAVGARGERLATSPRERSILALLLRNAGRVVPRRTIALELWGDEERCGRCIDVYMARIRAKLEGLAPGLGGRLQASRGQGYSLLVDRCG